MKAFILCAGFGSRMGTLTKDNPKCLIHINGESLLERHLKALKCSGIEEVIINLHYKGELIKNYLAEKNNFGLEITFSEERVIMGTGGALLHAKKLIGSEPFLLLSSDIYTDYPFELLVQEDWKNIFRLSDREFRAYLVGINYSESLIKDIDGKVINSEKNSDFSFGTISHDYDEDYVYGSFSTTSRIISSWYTDHTYSGIAVINPIILKYIEGSPPIELWRDCLESYAPAGLIIGETYLDNYYEEEPDNGIFININTQEDVKKVESILERYGKAK